MRLIAFALAGLCLAAPAAAQTSPDAARLHDENRAQMRQRAQAERLQALHRDAVAAEARARTSEALSALRAGRDGAVFTDYAADAAKAAAAIARRQDATLAESNARILAIQPASR